MLSVAIVVISCLVCIFVGSALLVLTSSAAIKKRLSGRGLRSIKELWAHEPDLFDMSENEFTELWMEMATLLYLDPEIIRPTDRFEDELKAPLWYAGEPLKYNIVEAFGARAADNVMVEHLSNAKSLGDCVRIIGSSRRKH